MHHPSPMEEGALGLTRELHRAGYQALWAGGCVRDRLMGRHPKDIDIATKATPDQVLEVFPDAIEVGKAFGVIRVVRGDHVYDIATFRKDFGYADGRRPDQVTFCDAREDALRRDFTINGMFIDPETGEVLDYVGGQSDLEAGIIRAIGDPRERFAEDHLRMLRAIRFASTLEFTIETATLEAVQAHAADLSKVSGERIEQELTRLLVESPRPGKGLTALLDTGLLAVFMPEAVAMKQQDQPPQYHPEGDVFTHTAMMLNGMREPTVHLAYSLLLHDIGKPPTATWGPGKDGVPRIRFDGHDAVGARMAEKILRRLRMSRANQEAIVHCVRYHMRFMNVPNMKRSTLRRIIGAPIFDTELELFRLDCLCSHGDLGLYDQLVALRDEIAKEPILPDPWLKGRDLLHLGLTEGPEIGRWLKRAYDRQLEGEAADREELLAWLIRERAQQSPSP